MRTVPVPDDFPAEWPRVVIGPSDPAHPDIHAVEYLVTPAKDEHGRDVPAFNAVLVLDDVDRATIAEGGRLVLTMFGAEVMWDMTVIPERLDLEGEQ